MRILNFTVGLATLFSTILTAAGEGSSEPNLAAAREKYEASHMTKVDAPFEIEIEKLNRLLDKALADEEEKAVKGGDLDLVTAFQAERKTLADSGEVESGDDGIPAKVKQFRDTWRKKKAALDTQRALARMKLLANFDVELQALEKSLTKERKIKEALAVRKYREGLAEDKPAPPTPATAKTDPEDEWINILDGKSLKGWRADLPNAFQLVEGGVRTEKPKGIPNARLYYTGDDQKPDIFKSFEVRIRAHLDGEKGNSGFYFHVPPSAVDKKVDGGFEVNIANGKDLMNQTGSIWSIKSVKRPIRGQDKSFELLIKVTEDRLTVSYDGRIIMDHAPKSAAERTFSKEGGAIAIQSNSTPGAYVFERIDIRKLD